jgi:hypothetical protein
MSPIEQLLGDKRLSSTTRSVAAEILRKMDPSTGRARITAEQLAAKLDIAVGAVRKATTMLTDCRYLQKVKAGRNIEFLLPPERP